MMTKKMYHTDPYLQQFTAKVDRIAERNSKPAIILERTAFYPASGGQPHDTGSIDDVAVCDVYENEAQEIVHVMDQPVEGKEVVGRIDWNRRFDHMQQHTGQHLLSQAFIRMHNADTISFHMGEESATLDLNQAGISADAVAAVERFANRIIYENRAVKSQFVSARDLDRYPVRNPPAVADDIRIIEIDNFDYSPCGGTHCSRTGEIGIIKISRFENYKDGTRIHFKCGFRAFQAYQIKSHILKQIGEHLSTGETELFSNIKKIQNELKRLRREHGALKDRYLDYEAQAILVEGRNLGNLNIISKVFFDRDPGDLKMLALKLVEGRPKVAVLFGANTGGKASLLFLRSEDIKFDMGKLMQQASAVLGGRGGGRPQQAQGGGPATDNLEMALQKAIDEISKKED
jgi:alanyl-tRNA synthetase